MSCGPAHRREQLIVRVDGRAGIHQDEAASAIGALYHAGMETGLTIGRCLLIARDAGDRYGPAEE
jgi:hypothetical protein